MGSRNRQTDSRRPVTPCSWARRVMSRTWKCCASTTWRGRRPGRPGRPGRRTGASAVRLTFDGTDVWFATASIFVRSIRRRATGEAKARGPLRSGHGLRWRAPLSGRQGRDPHHRSRDRRHPGARVPAPSENAAGLTWAEGSLWVGMYLGEEHPSSRSEDGSDPAHDRHGAIRHGRDVRGRRSLAWHLGGDESDIVTSTRETGELLEALPMPKGMVVSGLEFDGGRRSLRAAESPARSAPSAARSDDRRSRAWLHRPRS